MAFQPVLTPMLAVLNSALTQGSSDDSVLNDGFEVIQECCCMEYPLINGHIEVFSFEASIHSIFLVLDITFMYSQLIVPFLISIIQNAEYDENIRQAAAQTFISLLENRPKLVAQKELVRPCLTALVQLAAESNTSSIMVSALGLDAGAEDDDEDDDYSPEVEVQRLCQICIDSMAMNIPSKNFLQPALEISSQVSPFPLYD